MEVKNETINSEIEIEDISTFNQNYKELKKQYKSRPFLNKYQKILSSLNNHNYSYQLLTIFFLFLYLQSLVLLNVN